MNKYDLFDAMSGVDEELLARTEQPVRRLPLRKFVIAAAAVMLLAATVWAAPILAQLLFDTDYKQTAEGYVAEQEDGRLVVYADTYQIDFTLDNPDAVPDHFESYSIPTYFEENGWYQDYGYALNVFHRYPCMEYMWFLNRNRNTWVVFSQSVFVQMPGEPAPALGTGQFFLPIPPGYELKEETLQILGREVTAYRVDYEENFGERYLFWTDGQYAYQLSTTLDVTEEMIGEIIASIESTDDNSSYLKAGTYKVLPQSNPNDATEATAP